MQGCFRGEILINLKKMYIYCIHKYKCIMVYVAKNNSKNSFFKAILIYYFIII